MAQIEGEGGGEGGGGGGGGGARGGARGGAAALGAVPAVGDAAMYDLLTRLAAADDGAGRGRQPGASAEAIAALRTFEVGGA